jgi:hypothetical protein
VDAFGDVVELHAVYGFKTPIVIDLETVDSDWLDGHCDVVGFARLRAEVRPGLWLARGCVVEVSETRLVARRDERAVRTASGPIAVHFTRFERQGPPIRWEWANTGDCPPEQWQSPMREQRVGSPRHTRGSRATSGASTGAAVSRFQGPAESSLRDDEPPGSAARSAHVRGPDWLASAEWATPT